MKDKFLDAFERAATSAGQQFLAVVLAVAGPTTHLTDVPWKFGLSTAAGAFLISLLLTAAFDLTNVPVMSFWPNLLVRAVKTFVASLLATLGGGVVDVLSVPWQSALTVAALAAGASIAKGLVSPNAHLSPSLLPTPVVARLHGVSVQSGTFKK